MSEKVQTVNVIEYTGGSGILGMTSFKDNDKGNKEAESVFTKSIQSSYPETSKEDIDASIENGYFEQDDYQVFITHSN